MTCYIIEGGNKLKGKIAVSGNKNSILPCLAACLLTEEEVILRNVPKISDIDVFVELFNYLGATIQKAENTIFIKFPALKQTVLPPELISKIRASVLLVGPLLSKLGKIEFPHPGGDVIGKRSIETHLLGFEQLGFSFKRDDHYYKGFTKDKSTKDRQIFLDEASVTATENLILASVLGTSTITFFNCASEPSVVDLCNLLIKMGARIKGVGSQTLTIEGVKKLGGADFTIGSDFIEFGTYAIAAAITSGEIEIENIHLQGLEPITHHLQKMGLNFQDTEAGVKVWCGLVKCVPKLHTNIWPGFPTDLMSAVIVLATQAKGASLMHDWMYESRMFFVDKLISMGANITIADPHRVLIYGIAPLFGRNLETPDIRAGMALVLAALVASGQSTINRAELIERGYENVVDKLSSLGANIKKIEA